MTNNDIFRRLRFSFELNNKQVKDIFKLADLNVNEALIEQWLKKDDDKEFVAINDTNFATFLNGFIFHFRGKQEGKSRPAEKRLTNNIVLNKLKISLNLKAEDIIDMLAKVNFSLSKPELSAIFRKPDHKHYRECKDQLLRNFLAAVQLKYRKSPLPNSKVISSEDKDTKKHQSTYKGKFTENDTQKNENGDFIGKTARPGASKAYINPKATPKEEKKNTRKVLKIKPSDIWKNS